MHKKRLIPCIVIKDGIVVQSFNFKHYLPIGKLKIVVEYLRNWVADELILLDISARNEKRCFDVELLRSATKECFIPITVGGGISNLDDAKTLLFNGADKVCLNTSAFQQPSLISEIAQKFGNQSIVVSVDVIFKSNQYEVLIDGGRVATGMSPVDWAKKAALQGAGEIFLNSIDRDGSRLGYDVSLLKMVSKAVSVPVIGCGGVGHYQDFSFGIKAGCSAVAAANIFHHSEISVIQAKLHMRENKVDVRLPSVYLEKNCYFDVLGRL